MKAEFSEQIYGQYGLLLVWLSCKVGQMSLMPLWFLRLSSDNVSPVFCVYWYGLFSLHVCLCVSDLCVSVLLFVLNPSNWPMHLCNLEKAHKIKWELDAFLTAAMKPINKVGFPLSNSIHEVTDSVGLLSCFSFIVLLLFVLQYVLLLSANQIFVLFVCVVLYYKHWLVEEKAFSICIFWFLPSKSALRRFPQ